MLPCRIAFLTFIACAFGPLSACGGLLPDDPTPPSDGGLRDGSNDGTTLDTSSPNEAAPADAPSDSSEASSDDGGPLALSLSPALVHLVRGTSAPLTITADRGGYSGDIHVQLQGLPTGVIASSTTLPAGVSTTTVMLTASTDATLGPAQLTAGATGSASTPTATLLVQGASGTLDTTFGVNGIARVGFSQNQGTLGLANQQGLLLQNDGHIVLCGNIQTKTTDYDYGTVLARLGADGSLDTTFNGTGTVSWNPDVVDVPFGCGWATTSGRILMGGFLYTKTVKHVILAAAFNSDGSQDLSYGTLGEYIAGIATEAEIAQVAVLADGRMVAVGFSGPNAELFRLTADGSLDDSFGPSDAGGDAGHGLVIFPTGHYLNSVGLLSDGRVLVLDHDPLGLTVQRYSADGVFDKAYGGNSLQLAGYASLVVAPDDSVVVVGGLALPDGGASGVIELAHFQPDGGPDPAFGDGGTTAAMPPGDGAQYAAIAVGADGRIAAAVSIAQFPGGTSFSAAVFLPTGPIDSSFGANGYVTADVGSNALANNVAIDPLGRILVAGSADSMTGAPGQDAIVVRYWP